MPISGQINSFNSQKSLDNSLDITYTKTMKKQLEKSMNNMSLPLSHRYPYVLHFTKILHQFNDAEYSETLGFCSEADAKDWVSKVNANKTVPYTVKDDYFIEGFINI